MKQKNHIERGNDVVFFLFRTKQYRTRSFKFYFTIYKINTFKIQRLENFI
jgi:hypothetical protein